MQFSIPVKTVAGQDLLVPLGLSPGVWLLSFVTEIGYLNGDPNRHVTLSFEGVSGDELYFRVPLPIGNDVMGDSSLKQFKQPSLCVVTSNVASVSIFLDGEPSDSSYLHGLIWLFAEKISA